MNDIRNSIEFPGRVICSSSNFQLNIIFPLLMATNICSFYKIHLNRSDPTLNTSGVKINRFITSYHGYLFFYNSMTTLLVFVVFYSPIRGCYLKPESSILKKDHWYSNTSAKQSHASFQYSFRSPAPSNSQTCIKKAMMIMMTHSYPPLPLFLYCDWLEYTICCWLARVALCGSIMDNIISYRDISYHIVLYRIVRHHIESCHIRWHCIRLAIASAAQMCSPVTKIPCQ